MSAETAATVSDKVVDKMMGALERLVDARMFILGLTALFYLDIWLIGADLDPHRLTFDQSLEKIKILSVGDFADFFILYALLMVATFPGLRFIYSAVQSAYGSRYSRDLRTGEERQLSNWAFGLICMVVWDFAKGRFFTAGSYRGLTIYAYDAAYGGGLLTIVLRFSAAFFLILCLALALESDT